MNTVKSLQTQLDFYGVNLGSLYGTQNPKVQKGMIDAGYYGICSHLSPEYDIARMCPYSGLCRESCLDKSGNPAYWKGKKAARFSRSKLFLENRQLFIFASIIAIGRQKMKADRLGLRLAVRPNATHDWAHETDPLVVAPWHLPLLYRVGIRASVGDMLTLCGAFPTSQFYDYSKMIFRFNRPLPENYHLTFSLDGYKNVAHAREAIALGFNVAIPFSKDVDFINKIFDFRCGFTLPIINGDLNDMRFLDPIGVGVGLRYKVPTAPGLRSLENNGFVQESLTVADSMGYIFASA